jgi:hypothetical protein
MSSTALFEFPLTGQRNELVNTRGVNSWTGTLHGR